MFRRGYKGNHLEIEAEAYLPRIPKIGKHTVVVTFTAPQSRPSGIETQAWHHRHIDGIKIRKWLTHRLTDTKCPLLQNFTRTNLAQFHYSVANNSRQQHPFTLV